MPCADLSRLADQWHGSEGDRLADQWRGSEGDQGLDAHVVGFGAVVWQV